MSSELSARRVTPANSNQFFEQWHRRDPRAARDVAPGEPWAFFDHRSLAEVIASEERP